MTWRDKARPLIAAVISEIGTDDLPKLRRALREAYPWGPRELHPYKIWCDEIRVQLGTKPIKEPGAERERFPLFEPKELRQRELIPKGAKT